MAQWLTNPTTKFQVRSLALLSGRCGELWCRLQMQLGSGIAEALV